MGPFTSPRKNCHPHFLNLQTNNAHPVKDEFLTNIANEISFNRSNIGDYTRTIIQKVQQSRGYSFQQHKSISCGLPEKKAKCRLMYYVKPDVLKNNDKTSGSFIYYNAVTNVTQQVVTT